MSILTLHPLHTLIPSAPPYLPCLSPKIAPGTTRLGWVGTGVMGSHVRPFDRQGLCR